MSIALSPHRTNSPSVQHCVGKHCQPEIGLQPRFIMLLAHRTAVPCLHAQHQHTCPRTPLPHRQCSISQARAQRRQSGFRCDPVVLPQHLAGCSCHTRRHWHWHRVLSPHPAGFTSQDCSAGDLQWLQTPLSFPWLVSEKWQLGFTHWPEDVHSRMQRRACLPALES